MQTSRLRLLGAFIAFIIFWRTGWLQSLMLLPLSVMGGAWRLVFSSAEEVDSDSVQAAIFNVTSDPKKISELVQDFMHSPGIDARVELQFRVFLSRQKIRSFPRLETTLDWLLHLYWIILPALVFSMLCNLMARRQPSPAASEDGSPAGSPTHGTGSGMLGLRRPSGGAPQRAVSRRSSSGSLAVAPSLSRPSSSGGVARGLNVADITAVGPGGASSGVTGRKLF